MEYMKDLPHDAVILQLGDLRALERVRTEWVTHFVLLRSGLERFDKLVIDPLLNIYPGSGAAALAVVEENTKIDPRNRILNIRIVEDNIRALATKLQGNLFQIRASGRFHDLPANNGRSGESDLVNVHVGREGSTGNLAEAGDDVDDTRWEASFFDELGGVEGAERGLFGGLENDDVAAGNGRADLPGPHEEWEIPWDDLRADTDLDGLLSVSGFCKAMVGSTNRFLLGVVERLGIRLNNLAVDLICPAAVISEASGAHTNVDFGHAECFAIVQGFDRCEEVEVLFEQICQLHQVFSSLLIGDLAPCGLKGFAGNGDGVVDIFFGGFVDCADRFLGGGVDGLESLAILSFDELVVDEAVGSRSVCGLELLVGARDIGG